MTTDTAAIPRRSLGYLLGMTILMFGANFVWVSYASILLLPLVQRVVAPEYSSLTVGVIAFFSTIVGITVSILTGIISDHSTSRWGRRGPAILVGALVGLPFIACAGILHLSLPVIAISYLGTQFFTNVANGAWWPLLVDTVPANQRGLATGLQGFFTLAAAAAGFVVVTYLNEINQAGTALIVMGAVFAATGIVNVLTIRPYDKPAVGAQRISLWKAFRGMFSVRTRVTVFFWLVFSAFLVNMGFSSLQYFARDFLRIYLGLANPDAGLRLFGLVSLVPTMLAAVAAGLLSDRFGRRRLILLGALGCGLTTLLMALTRDLILFLVLAGIRSIALGPAVGVVPALASDLSPKDEAGQYMAYNNLSTGVSAAVSSLLFGAVLNMRGAPTVESFTLLLVVAAVFFLLGGIVFQVRVPQRELDERLSVGAIA